MKKFKDATAMGFQTLLGHIGSDFPMNRGNCFGLQVRGREYKIINFYAENFEHLIEEKVISYPVKIEILSKIHANVIHLLF